LSASGHQCSSGGDMSPVVKCLVDMVPSSCTLTTDVHLSDTAL